MFIWPMQVSRNFVCKENSLAMSPVPDATSINEDSREGFIQSTNLFSKHDVYLKT